MVGVILAEISYRFLVGHESACSQGLIEGEVGLVGHAVGSSGVDDVLVEEDDGQRLVILLVSIEVFFALVNDALWNLLDIGVETHAEEALLLADLLYQLLTIHDFLISLVIEIMINLERQKAIIHTSDHFQKG